MLRLGGQAIDAVFLVSTFIIVFFLGYLAILVLLAVFRKPNWRYRDYSVFEGNTPEVIFVMPCLNEASVVGDSIRRLLKMNYDKLNIVVIDDGSDDGTGDIVRSFKEECVTLFQRQLPHARQGKGKALNAAFQYIYDGNLIRDLDPANTIIIVVDADGRMDTESLNYVLPAFDDPELAGVQIGVRINNRVSNLLARMQDVEFVLYTEVFQRGRVKMGSVGLGGNGQFVRLSALRLLGRNPWSDSLTEDLDLGIRLHLLGLRLNYCPEVAVHQQGLESLKRWVRQRTRWFQGFLQGWGQIANVLNRLWGTTRFDLFMVLISPVVLLFVTFFTLSFVIWLFAFGIGLINGTTSVDWRFAIVYLLAFGPTLVLSAIYRKNEPGLGMLKALGLAHAYVFYAQLWGIAGWKAVWNQLRGRTGWAKTERVAETSSEDDHLNCALQSPKSENKVSRSTPNPGELGAAIAKNGKTSTR